MAQSMGGYVSQAFMRLFSDGVAASRPLDRSCYAAIELWALKHVKGIYRAIPWKSFSVGLSVLTVMAMKAWQRMVDQQAAG